MVPVSGGEFTMGILDDPNRGDDEWPAHQVEISDFWMGKHEIGLGSVRVMDAQYRPG